MLSVVEAMVLSIILKEDLEIRGFHPLLQSLLYSCLAYQEGVWLKQSPDELIGRLIDWLCSSLLSGPAPPPHSSCFPKLNPDWLVSDAWPAVNQSVVKATLAPIKDPPTLEVNWMDKKKKKKKKSQLMKLRYNDKF